MAVRLSRRKVTRHIADQLVAGESEQAIVTQLAAFLIDSRRTGELDLIVRDIEYALSGRGVVMARVVSASSLADATRAAIKDFVANGAQVQLEEFIDPTVLGGVRIDTPGKQFDSTIIRRLTMLKTNFKK